MLELDQLFIGASWAARAGSGIAEVISPTIIGRLAGTVVA
jgi:hypothetical protein